MEIEVLAARIPQIVGVGVTDEERLVSVRRQVDIDVQPDRHGVTAYVDERHSRQNRVHRSVPFVFQKCLAAFEICEEERALHLTAVGKKVFAFGYDKDVSLHEKPYGCAELVFVEHLIKPFKLFFRTERKRVIFHINTSFPGALFCPPICCVFCALRSYI